MPPRRPRVLMMVDNKVAGDSRVLKTAQSVSDLGYRVTLLGRRGPDAVEFDEDFRVKLARVRRRMPVEQERGFVGRHPLAYPNEAAAAQPTGSNALATRWHRLRQARRTAAIEATLEQTRALTAGAAGRPAVDLLADDVYWQTLQPILVAYENAYAPIIDKVRPHVIHAHDFRMVGIAVRAARRQRRRIRVIYDAHEFLPGLEETPEFLVGNSWYEASHIRLADRVVAVSEPLADLLLEQHGLDRRPEVTLNAPEESARQIDPGFTQNVRGDCGLTDGVPLLVYSGGVAPRRGLDIVVRGLAHLPGVHLAIIANRDEVGRRLIAETAETAGVTDRVHVLDFVPRERIVQHLRTADLAVHPMIHLPNHEIALPNKFFDYVFAGLPLVVSDVRHLADVVARYDLGGSFPARDPAAFAAVTQRVLADLPRYRESVRACPELPRWTWEAQEPVLERIYSQLLS